MGHENSLRGDDGEFITKEWETVKVISGIAVLYNPNKPAIFDLPIKANTARYYFKQNKGGEIIQLRVYDENHNALLDIDINPAQSHHNLKKGICHVHEFTVEDGEIKRAKKAARYLNEEEIKKYNPIIALARPDARFK